MCTARQCGNWRAAPKSVDVKRFSSGPPQRASQMNWHGVAKLSRNSGNFGLLAQRMARWVPRRMPLSACRTWLADLAPRSHWGFIEKLLRIDPRPTPGYSYLSEGPALWKSARNRKAGRGGESWPVD